MTNYLNYTICLKLDFIESSVFLRKELYIQEPIQIGQILLVFGIAYYVSNIIHVLDNAYLSEGIIEAYSVETIKHNAKDLLEKYSVAEWEIKRD